MHDCHPIDLLALDQHCICVCMYFSIMLNESQEHKCFYSDRGDRNGWQGRKFKLSRLQWMLQQIVTHQFHQTGPQSEDVRCSLSKPYTHRFNNAQAHTQFIQISRLQKRGVLRSTIKRAAIRSKLPCPQHATHFILNDVLETHSGLNFLNYHYSLMRCHMSCHNS